MTWLGVDYAWQHPTLPGGCTFVLRYLSNDPGKNLTRAEADSLRAQGQDIGVVWETTTNEVDGGYVAGVAAAQKAEQQAAAAGMPAGSPIYFAVDYDAQVGPIISGYFQGAAEVLGGVNRVGVYGGYHVVGALLDAGLVTYVWQTSAWSTVNGVICWHPRAHIQQYGYNDVYDWNRREVADFGQWRTGAPVDTHPGARTIAVGASGPDVAELQRCLGIVSDGVYGVDTKIAVQVFQEKVGLTTDGICGADTWVALVYGSIGDLYRSPGMTPRLGAPLVIESPCADGAGRYVHFANSGSIYWYPATDPHEIHGAIRLKWEQLGWEGGILGYPISDEMPCSDDRGRYNHFQRGSIYWSSATGAHEVHGAIRDAWAETGWEGGPWGYPTTDEYAEYPTIDEHANPGDRGQNFQRCTVYWNADTQQVSTW